MSQVDQAVRQVEAKFTVLKGQVSEQQNAVARVDLNALLSLPVEVVPVIFQSVLTLDEDDFEYELPDPRSTLERVRGTPFEAEIINLIELKPELKKFRKYLGQPELVSFSDPYNGVLVTCLVTEDWYLEFSDLIEEAQGLARARAAEVKEAVSQEQAAELKRHTQRLRLLLDDGGFLKLARVKSTAQRTLLSYARQKEPEAVAALGEQRMKELLGELRDWVLVHQSK
ncbi:hypothetical protein ACFOPQ_07725 [Deinococcus antarcticus]|uniref:Uncharacterized protein n=1 Tax=Deinococcus antarcticus TaxID=1298767 RepID=A0ABV8A4M5_9DEIO